ncbi:MAG: hypothetical protein H6512_01150 [Acidimicrobiia bacterium]|nr:hypothetical protein [Acidimicrobiia bacterium]
MRDAFGLVELPDSYQQDARLFGCFIELRRWANFFKHPGVFGYLMHEPRYTYQDIGAEHSLVKSETDTTVVITSKVVNENWKFGAPGKSQKLPKTLFAKKRTALVVLPNISELALRLEKEVTTITDILCVPPFSSRLTEKSTIEDYFQA